MADLRHRESSLSDVFPTPCSHWIKMLRPGAYSAIYLVNLFGSSYWMLEGLEALLDSGESEAS
jgi:hypothetical protein